MEKTNRELLIRDICSRLPYGVFVKFRQYTEPLLISIKDALAVSNGGEMLDDIQYLYLRPMSSMTEEELDELLDCEDIDFDGKSELVKRAMLAFAEGDKLLSNALFSMQYAKTVDWLNAHHFDFRNLIERGLAIDCTDLNVY